MKAKNFNKSQIMKRAWNCYRKHNDTMTFGQCLKWSWKKAWEELRKVSLGSWIMASMHKEQKIEKRRAETNKRIYRNVVFGRNDWVMDYGRRYRRFAC